MVHRVDSFCTGTGWLAVQPPLERHYRWLKESIHKWEYYRQFGYKMPDWGHFFKLTNWYFWIMTKEVVLLKNPSILSWVKHPQMLIWFSEFGILYTIVDIFFNMSYMNLGSVNLNSFSSCSVILYCYPAVLSSSVLPDWCTAWLPGSLPEER